MATHKPRYQHQIEFFQSIGFDASMIPEDGADEYGFYYHTGPSRADYKLEFHYWTGDEYERFCKAREADWEQAKALRTKNDKK